MKPYQQRVIDEKTELDERLSKLEAFRETDAWDQLPDEDQDLLINQTVIMHQYSEVLERRIARF